jgi:Family of unknown function (DUF5947)
VSSTLTSLERFVALARRARIDMRCELCAAALGEDHSHVVDRTARRLLCACSACFVAFAGEGHPRFRAVPQRIRAVEPGLHSVDLEALGVPVGLAYFFRSSTLDRWIAVFPSPAGPTEAELPDGALERLAASTTVGGISDDVEAILVYRRRSGSVASFIVPIDICYELTGLVRRHWRGIDGADEANALIETFVARLGERAERRMG